MRIVVAAVAGVLACWCVTATADEFEEKPLGDLKCKIGLPKGWKGADKVEKSKGTKTAMSAIRAEGPDGKVCIVICAEIEELKDDKQVEILFKSAREKKDDKIDKVDVTNDLKDKIESVKGLKTSEFLVTLKDKRKFKTLMIIKDKRVYTIMIGGAKDGYYKDEEAIKIFESLKLD